MGTDRPLHRDLSGIMMVLCRGSQRILSADFQSRDAYAKRSGEALMSLVATQLRPRDIVTRDALENAATVVAASGGSTNAGLPE